MLGRWPTASAPPASRNPTLCCSASKRRGGSATTSHIPAEIAESRAESQKAAESIAFRIQRHVEVDGHLKLAFTLCELIRFEITKSAQLDGEVSIARSRVHSPRRVPSAFAACANASASSAGAGRRGRR